MKRILVPGLFGMAAYFAVFGGEYSVLEVRQARVQVAQETARLQELKAINDSLAARADSAETDPATIERMARERWGMIRPGEVLYRFAEPNEDQSAEPAGEPTERD